MKMNPKDILVPAVSLFIISLVATLLLAVVNNVTVDRINELAAQAEAEARVAVQPEAKDFKESTKGNINYYEALDANGNVIGYVFNCVGANKGYGGDVAVTVGIDTQGVITGVVPGDVSNETPGLGQNASKASWLKQFTGKSGKITVVKNSAGDDQINAITSATITSTAVTSGVNLALEQFAEIGGGNNG